MYGYKMLSKSDLVYLSNKLLTRIKYNNLWKNWTKFKKYLLLQLPNQTQLPDRADQGGVRLLHAHWGRKVLRKKIHCRSQEQQATRKGKFNFLFCSSFEIWENFFWNTKTKNWKKSLMFWKFEMFSFIKQKLIFGGAHMYRR